MHKSFIRLAAIIVALMAGQPGVAGQFVVELAEPLPSPQQLAIDAHNIKLSDTLSAGVDSYAIFTAPNRSQLEAFLETTSINAEKISEVLFVNSPTIGGGKPSDSVPRPGHQVFVIERPIPGVGFFGLDKKQRISQNSNSAVAKLGDIIEWDKSYLTSEGTYCIYRADTSATLREHGALAGAPIGKITPVTQVSFSE